MKQGYKLNGNNYRRSRGRGRYAPTLKRARARDVITLTKNWVLCSCTPPHVFIQSQICWSEIKGKVGGKALARSVVSRASGSGSWCRGYGSIVCAGCQVRRNVLFAQVTMNHMLLEDEKSTWSEFAEEIARLYFANRSRGVRPLLCMSCNFYETGREPPK